MKKKMAAIDEIQRAWGVSDKDKVMAIRMVLCGANPTAVVTEIQNIANAMGALEALRQDNKVSM